MSSTNAIFLVKLPICRDSSRSKYTIGAGLPKYFAPSDVKILEKQLPESAQWLYTGGKNSEYLFVLGGPSINTFVAKLNSTTLEVLQVKKLRPAIYLGGLLVHENGNLYAVQGNVLTAYWNCDLDNATSVRLPSRINSFNIIQTNGMVVSSDGLLVIRQWPYLIEDSLMVIYAIPPITIGFCLVFCTVFWFSLSSKSTTRASVLNTAYRLVRGCVFCALIYALAFSLLTYKMAGSYNIWRYLFKTGATSGSELKLIDPFTLEVSAEIVIPERCAYARTALSTIDSAEEGTETEDVIVLVCEEFSRQFRWNPATKNLREMSNWATRYRTRGTGSFAGTGPAIFNGTAFYTDNTFAIGVYGDSYSIFRQRLDRSIGSVSVNESSLSFQSDRLSPKGMPGFMFWSVVISPYVGNVIVWDTMGRTVQSRSINDLSVRWSVSAANADCISVAADKGHVYFSDLSDAPNSVFTWSPGVSPLSHFLFPDVTKYLIVADVDSGSIIANITIMRGPGIKASLIVPGVNNDVFVGTASGVSRIYV